jgi:hypothetical protein
VLREINIERQKEKRTNQKGNHVTPPQPCKVSSRSTFFDIYLLEPYHMIAMISFGFASLVLLGSFRFTSHEIEAIYTWPSTQRQHEGTDNVLIYRNHWTGEVNEPGWLLPTH